MTDFVVTTELINALHFRRGIQNMQVADMEWEIPIPPQPITSNRHSLPVPLSPTTIPTNTSTVHRRLSKKSRHRKIWSKHEIPSEPATLQTAKEENARQSYISTAESA